MLASILKVPLPLMVLTKPFVKRLERAGMLVVAKVEVPVTNRGPATVRAVAEALCRELCPDTVRILEMVVEPVTAKVLEAELKVKLEEVARVLLPAPNRMSLAIKFWSWTVGVRPPEDRMEPLPETEVT